MQQDEKKPKDQTSENLTRKEYRTPTLRRYGNITELTRNVTNTTVSDNPVMKS